MTMCRERETSSYHYLTDQDAIIASRSLDLIAAVTGFDILELWVSHEGSVPVEEGTSPSTPDQECLIFVHASKEVLSKYADILAGVHVQCDERQHTLSRQLCRLLLQSNGKNFHWRSCSGRNGSMEVLYEYHALPLRTEMAFRFAGDTRGVNIFVVGFAFDEIQRQDSFFNCLTGVLFALYSTVFFRARASNDGKSDDSTAIVDLKSLSPDMQNAPDSSHAKSLSLPEVVNGSSGVVDSCLLRHELTEGMIKWNRSITDLQERGQNDVGVEIANDHVGQYSDEAERQEKVTQQVSVNDNWQSKALPVASQDGVGNTNPQSASVQRPSYPVPKWEPHSSFNFPVASIPIRLMVRCDLVFPDSFENITHLSDGSNSNIFRCSFNGTDVIVKMMKIEIEKDRTALHEYDIEFGLLARMDHPNIIRILGSGVIPRRFIVLEHLSGGTLTHILSQRHKNTFTGMIFRKATYSYEELLHKARDMADAFDYLHARCHPGATILHRDLKPDNIGFAQDGSLKLFDFGLATLVNTRTHSSQRYKMSGYTGSLRYMAPEVALRKRYGEKVDVYSYAIVLWQMARDRTPFNSISTVEEFMDEVVHRGLRPKLDKSLPSNFNLLLSSCWHREPELRPSFAMIVTQLDRYIHELSIGKSGASGSKDSITEPTGDSRPDSAGANTLPPSAPNTNSGIYRAPSTAKRGKTIAQKKHESETQSTWF